MHETQLAKELLNVVLDRSEGARVLRVFGSIAETEALRLSLSQQESQRRPENSRP